METQTVHGILTESAWEHHHKRSRFETRDLVVPMVIAMDLDWDRFERNHAAYRVYWDRHGWQFNPETLLAWVRNGMMPPPSAPNARDIPTSQPKPSTTQSYISGADLLRELGCDEPILATQAANRKGV